MKELQERLIELVTGKIADHKILLLQIEAKESETIFQWEVDDLIDLWWECYSEIQRLESLLAEMKVTAAIDTLFEPKRVWED